MLIPPVGPERFMFSQGGFPFPGAKFIYKTIALLTIVTSGIFSFLYHSDGQVSDSFCASGSLSSITSVLGGITIDVITYNNCKCYYNKPMKTMMGIIRFMKIYLERLMIVWTGSVPEFVQKKIQLFNFLLI